MLPIKWYGPILKRTISEDHKDINTTTNPKSPKNKEDIEDMLVVAFNKAIEDADHVNENEMKSTASGLLPGMGA